MGDLIHLAPRAAMVVAILELARSLVIRAVTDPVTKRLPDPADPRYFDWSRAFVLKPMDDRRRVSSFACGRTTGRAS